MVSPSNPSLASLVVEGLYQAGDYTPSTALTSRYQTEIMEQLKNEIWKKCRQPKTLQTFAYGVLVAGQSRYSCPSDFSSDLKMVILTGTVTGTAQGGTSSTLILQSGSNFALTDVLGREVLIISGTGIGSCGQIIGLTNNAGTITVNVTPSFSVAPNATSGYMMIDQQWPVTTKHVADYLLRPRVAEVGRPTEAYPTGDEDFDEFIFDRAPDSVFNYGVKYFYYANIMRTDTSSALMSRLYLEWRNFWINGIRAKRLMENDDSRGEGAWNLWMMEVSALVGSAQYGTDLHEDQQVITDYY